MSTVKSLTAAGVATGKHAILFGITVSSVIDPTAPPPSGDVVFEVRDSTAADGTGDLIARLLLTAGAGSSMNTLTFPAGVRCSNGIAVNITNSSPAAHDSLVVSIDYS